MYELYAVIQNVHVQCTVGIVVTVHVLENVGQLMEVGECRQLMCGRMSIIICMLYLHVHV